MCVYIYIYIQFNNIHNDDNYDNIPMHNIYVCMYTYIYIHTYIHHHLSRLKPGQARAGVRSRPATSLINYYYVH